MEVSDEDWFYDSISRYEDLYMFELEYPIQQVDYAGTDSICVACSNTKRHQLLELSLPSKLLSPDNTITSDTDLKIKCGTYIDTMCHQMKNIAERKILVSQVGQKGVSMYSLPSDSDEIKKETIRVDSQLETPKIAANDLLVWLTKTKVDEMHLYDLHTAEAIQNLKVDEKIASVKCDETIIPMFFQPNVVGFGGQVTGEVYIADHRMPSGLWCFITSHLGTNEDLNHWSFASPYEDEGTKEFVENTCYAKISNSGKILVFDIRNIEVPVHSAVNLGLKSKNTVPLQVRFKPGKRDWISVSGFNGNVYVYELQQENDPNLLFTHDGHKHVEGYSSQTEVTSHLWSRTENFVISSADNGTIQMWDFGKKER